MRENPPESSVIGVFGLHTMDTDENTLKETFVRVVHFFGFGLALPRGGETGDLLGERLQREDRVYLVLARYTVYQNIRWGQWCAC